MKKNKLFIWNIINILLSFEVDFQSIAREVALSIDHHKLHERPDERTSFHGPAIVGRAEQGH